MPTAPLASVGYGALARPPAPPPRARGWPRSAPPWLRAALAGALELSTAAGAPQRRRRMSIPDYTPPAVIGSLARDDHDPTPRQIEEAIAYARGMCEATSREGILLFALDQMTMERDDFYREAQRLREEGAVLKQ